MKSYTAKLKILIITLLVSIFSLQTAVSQPLRKHQAKAYINRTVLILREAREQLNIGKNYTGDFAKAVAHQKLARNLFQSGEFQKAVFHSHRARQLAFATIRNNKGMVKKDFESTKEEESLQTNAPKDEELDRAMKISEPDNTFDDRAAAKAQVKEIDDKEK